ncbi:MAG: hypothetical protein VW715_15650 [Rhodospirillales bacterium]
MSNRIDSAMAEQILQGDDTDPDILQSLGLELIAELKRCYDFIDSHGLDEDIEHKMVIDLRECSWECLHQLCVQAGVEDGTKEEMIARLLE